jgi:hypothetical protein
LTAQFGGATASASLTASFLLLESLEIKLFSQWFSHFVHMFSPFSLLGFIVDGVTGSRGRPTESVASRVEQAMSLAAGIGESRYGCLPPRLPPTSM